MKKTLISVLGLMLALAMCATTAFAADSGRGRNFVDTDGDGVCDNAGSIGMNAGADKEEISDHCVSDRWCGMAETGNGKNFVDANGDGVCDHYETGQGNGCGRGCQGGRGNGFRGGRGR